MTLRSCCGFSTGSWQAAAVVPLLGRSSLTHQFAQGYLLVHCLGSWCVIRSVTSTSAACVAPAGFINHESTDYAALQRNFSQLSLSDSAGPTKGIHETPAYMNNDRLTQQHAERVFTRHCNKVTLIIYSPALNVCLSAELQPASKGAVVQPACRIWSPHTLKELALVQLPSQHDVASAHFSEDGSVLLMLLADPHHSLAIYSNVALQKIKAATADSDLPARLPRTLLLIVAQEGLVQLLPLAALTSSRRSREAPLEPRPPAPPAKEPLQHEHDDSIRAKTIARRTARSPGGSARQHRYRRPLSGSRSSASGRTCMRLKQALRSTALVPPFATGWLDAPARTPRSTYEDSVGRRCSSRNRRYRHSESAGSQRPAMVRSASRTIVGRPSSADSRASTRSSTWHCANQQDHEQQRLSRRAPAHPRRKGQRASACSLLPKRSLTTQRVASRYTNGGEDRETEELWLPLHSSQVVALHWSEPVLLLCTRTQIMAVNTSNLSEDDARVLQERPLGNIDVTALLHLSTPPADSNRLDSADGQHIQEEAECNSPLQPLLCILVTGGRCCVGGELRFWELCAAKQSTPPIYFKAPVTAVAAGALAGGSSGMVAVGTEEGRIMLLSIRQKSTGKLERPVLLWDRQPNPRPITALSVDRQGSFMAVATTSGHVDCYRLTLFSRRKDDLNSNFCIQGSFRGNGAYKKSAAMVKSGDVVEVVLQTTLHAPFSTPPKVLKFGESSECQGQLLVATTNSPACVYAIPEGRTLASSVLLDGTLNGFFPMFLPIPVALGVKGAESPSDYIVHLLDLNCSTNHHVMSNGPLLLTGPVGCDMLFFTHDYLQRGLCGMQIQCVKLKQKDGWRSHGDAVSLPTQGSETVEQPTDEGSMDAMKKHNPVSQFLRGSGLASLFRDFDTRGRPTATYNSLSEAADHLKPQLSTCSRAIGASEGANSSHSSEAPHCISAFAKLPHMSAPTGLFWCLNMKPVTPAGGRRQKHEYISSAAVLSASVEGHILIWNYKLDHRGERSTMSGNSKSAQDDHALDQQHEHSAKEDHRKQFCGSLQPLADGEVDQLQADIGREEAGTSQHTKTERPISQVSLAGSILDGSPAHVNPPEVQTVVELVCSKAKIKPLYEDNAQERAPRNNTPMSAGAPRACILNQKPDKKTHGSLPLKTNHQQNQRLIYQGEFFHRFLYRVVEHHYAYEVEVALPGGVVEQVRRDFASNTLVFSGRLNDPSWKIKLPSASRFFLDEKKSLFPSFDNGDACDMSTETARSI
ncbi:hypothetical protein Efla_000892 [Eimeria flavescens]